MLIRESIGKLLSAAGFSLGFLRVGWTGSKRAWHDTLAGTSVVQAGAASGRTRRILLAECLVLIAWLYQPVVIRLGALPLASPEVKVPRYTQRHRSQLVEVTSLGLTNRATFLEWINSQSQDPAEHVIQLAASHQLTLVGEYYGVREGIAFLNQLLPNLYHQAGVSCLAMEVCAAEDNALLHRLVTADEFDEKLALRIARRTA